MDKNIKIAKKLVKLAKSLIATDEINQQEEIKAFDKENQKFLKDNIKKVENAIKSDLYKVEIEEDSYNPDCFVIKDKNTNECVLKIGREDFNSESTFYCENEEGKGKQNLKTLDDALRAIPENIKK